MKVAILSDSPFIPTGYSNQSKQLVKYLTDKGHEIHWLANAYNGTVIDSVRLSDGTEFNCKIYGHFGNDQYFNQTMSQYLKKLQIDRFIILLDTFMLYPWFLNVDTIPAKTFFWFPSDGGGGLPKGCEKIIQKINQPVAMAKFGQKQVKDYYNLDVEHIPHGLDTTLFYKFRQKEKTELKSKWGLNGKFVIGVVARNQPRKHLDRTIKAMRIIADKIPNAVLLLHLDMDDPAQPVFQIRELVKKYNLENRVVATGMKAHQGFPKEKMKEVYNLMDCFLLTTSGEGFGIPIIEAMACGVPVVATDYTTTPELVLQNNAGLGIKLSGTETIDMFEKHSKEYDMAKLNGTLTGSWEVERGICDIYDCAEKVEFIYKNPKKAKEMGENGVKAVKEKYDFKKVGEAWDKIIQ